MMERHARALTFVAIKQFKVALARMAFLWKQNVANKKNYVVWFFFIYITLVILH